MKDDPAISPACEHVALPNRGLLLLACLNLGAVLGVVYSWALFLIPLEEQYGWERSETSLTYTFMLIFFCIGQICGGALLERFGARRTTLVGASLLSLGFLCSSWVSDIWQLYVSYGLIAGIGLGIANVVPTSVCMGWFPSHRGVVGGLCHMSLPIGTLFYGALLSGALIASIGVMLTFRVLGCVFISMAALCALVLRLPTQKDLDALFSAVGLSESENYNVWGVRTNVMLRDPSYKYIWLWSLIIQTCGWLVSGHAGPYAVEKGFSLELMGLVVGAFAIGNGLGKLALGMGWDKFGQRLSMLAGMSVLSLGMAGLAFFPSIFGGWGIAAFAGLAAIGFGGLFSLMSALLMAFYGPRYYGMNFAVSATPLLLAAVAGPYLGSLLREMWGSYEKTFLVALILCCMGYIMILRIKKPVF